MMKLTKYVAVFALLLGIVGVSHAGTPQETYFPSQFPLSGTTILASSASAAGGAFSLTIATPSVNNSGGGSFNGRICITKFELQLSSVAIVTIADNLTTKWTLYGADLGVSQANTLLINEEHLAPFCITTGDQMVISVTQGAGAAGANAQAIDVEGYTTYGGDRNAGNMQ